MKVLIVEDDLALASQLEWMLKKKGWDVSCAHSRSEAENKLLNEKPEVVILDLGIPPEPHSPAEGLKLLEFINVELPACKVIVLTGHSEKESIKKAVKEGAFDYVCKPAKPEEILKAVERASLFLSAERELRREGIYTVSFSVEGKSVFKEAREKAVFKVIKQILEETGFNIYQTAKKLATKRENIYYFIKKFGLKRNE